MAFNRENQGTTANQKKNEYSGFLFRIYKRPFNPILTTMSQKHYKFSLPKKKKKKSYQKTEDPKTPNRTKIQEEIRHFQEEEFTAAFISCGLVAERTLHQMRDKE